MIDMKRNSIYLAADITLDELGDVLPVQFSGIAYSGGLVQGYQSIVIDLASTSIEASMPLLFQHDHAQVLGAVREAVNDGRSLAVQGDLFSDIDETAKNVALKAMRGARYQMSVGLFDMTIEDVPAGMPIAVNGRDFAGPITVLRNGIIREVSIVALGADSGTTATFFSAARAAPSTEGVTPMADQAVLDALQSRVAALDAEIAELKSENQALKDAAATVALASRDSKIAELSARTGKAYSADEIETLRSMNDAQFSLLDASAVALVDGSVLFVEQATSGASKTQTAVTLSALSIYADRKAGK